MNMEYIMPEGLRAYMDVYHGQFSRKLAEFAISRMQVKRNSVETAAIKQVPVEKVIDILKQNGIHVSEECTYTAWYLYHMAIANYPRTCDNDSRRAWFVDETINDPDGKASDTLACFRAKMDNAGVPIMWELMI